MNKNDPCYVISISLIKWSILYVEKTAK